MILSSAPMASQKSIGICTSRTKPHVTETTTSKDPSSQNANLIWCCCGVVHKTKGTLEMDLRPYVEKF